MVKLPVLSTQIPSDSTAGSMFLRPTTEGTAEHRDLLHHRQGLHYVSPARPGEISKWASRGTKCWENDGDIGIQNDRIYGMMILMGLYTRRSSERRKT